MNTCKKTFFSLLLLAAAAQHLYSATIPYQLLHQEKNNQWKALYIKEE